MLKIKKEKIIYIFFTTTCCLFFIFCDKSKCLQSLQWVGTLGIKKRKKEKNNNNKKPEVNARICLWRWKVIFFSYPSIFFFLWNLDKYRNTSFRIIRKCVLFWQDWNKKKSIKSPEGWFWLSEIYQNWKKCIWYRVISWEKMSLTVVEWKEGTKNKL